MFDLINVVISVPLPGLREAPDVRQIDGDLRARGQDLLHDPGHVRNRHEPIPAPSPCTRCCRPTKCGCCFVIGQRHVDFRS